MTFLQEYDIEHGKEIFFFFCQTARRFLYTLKYKGLVEIVSKVLNNMNNLSPKDMALPAQLGFLARHEKLINLLGE